jgi:hypothetical protein
LVFDINSYDSKRSLINLGSTQIFFLFQLLVYTFYAALSFLSKYSTR